MALKDQHSRLDAAGENIKFIFSLLFFKDWKKNAILCLYAFFLLCWCLPVSCRFPRRRPPAPVTARNRTLCTPDCCWPGRFLLPGHGGRSSCRRGISCRRRFLAASPQAGRTVSRRRGPRAPKRKTLSHFFMVFFIARFYFSLTKLRCWFICYIHSRTQEVIHH